MKERIQKVLAAAGVASRRNVEQMVLDGRVSVNGKIMRALPILVDPQRDKLMVDDEKVRIEQVATSSERVYFLMNKPKGIYSTNLAQGEQTRAIDLLPPGFPYRVFPVGRLDADSKGLLLLTNDGELTNKLTHPKFGVSKTYRAVIDGFVDPQAAKQLEQGVWLADPHKGGFRTGQSRIKVVKRGRERSVLEITIREGRNRQVRRMLARIGHKVRELTRIKMGPLELNDLPLGAVRPLRAHELKALFAAVDRAEARTERLASEPKKPPTRPANAPRMSRPAKKRAAL